MTEESQIIADQGSSSFNDTFSKERNEKPRCAPSSKHKSSSKSNANKSSKHKQRNKKTSESSASSYSTCVDDYIPVHTEPKKDSEISCDDYSIDDLEIAQKRTVQRPSLSTHNKNKSTTLPSVTGSINPSMDSTKVSRSAHVSSTISVRENMKKSFEESSSSKIDLEGLLGSISNETKEAILRLVFANHGKTDDHINEEIEPKANDSAKKFLSHSVSSTSGETESVSLNSSSSVPAQMQKARPVIHDGAYFTAIYLLLIVLTMTYQAYQTIALTMTDGFYYRLISFVMYPLFFAMVMFPFRIAFYNGLTLFGSWRNVYINSKYHSAELPPKVPRNELPCVCVQMPIYKESFVETIQPSLDNIQRAIDHYKEQGGEAFMFINDDGLQLIDEEERQVRIEYFQRNNIAYIARPGPKILPRHGLFKKASNMNFCLNFAMEVANIFFKRHLDDDSDLSSGSDISSAASIQEAMKNRSYPVMAGGPIERLKQVRYILIVDSDTRVPETCLYDTVGEFVYDPEVGFVQHATSVLRVDDNYWEAMLAHFTHLLYSVFIPMGTALGEPSPLVGHNATLNWPAIQEVSWYDEEVQYRKYWSESHVSEDFDLSMRLQTAGYIGRYALYTGDGFQEGVSVTVHDEIKKLKKYAFGSGEMLFNPCKDWCRKGVLSPLLKGYLTSTFIPWHARVNLVAYLFNYVSMFIGVVVLPLSFYVGFLDPNQLSLPTAWQVMIGTSFIFGVVGTLNAVLFTLFLGHHQSFPMAFIYEVSRMLPLSFFFVGLSYHICTSFARYMLSMKAEWGATVKELDSSLCHYNFLTFMNETIKTVRAYWDMYLYLLVVSGLMAFFFLVIGPNMDVHWSGFAASPFCLFLAGHAAMPIILNPIAMRSIYYPIRNALCCVLMCPFIFLKTAQPEEPEVPTNHSNQIPSYVEPDAVGRNKIRPEPSSLEPSRNVGRMEQDMDLTSQVSVDSDSYSESSMCSA